MAGTGVTTTSVSRRFECLCRHVRPLRSSLRESACAEYINTPRPPPQPQGPCSGGLGPQQGAAAAAGAQADGPLTPAQHQQFREAGYLVCERLLQPSELDAAVDHIWRHAPHPVDRARPATWTDPQRRWAASETKYLEQPVFLPPDAPAYRLYEGHDDPAWLALLPLHPKVIAVATALLGEAPRPPRRIRGF